MVEKMQIITTKVLSAVATCKKIMTYPPGETETMYK